jgi:hypothetical protein
MNRGAKQTRKLSFSSLYLPPPNLNALKFKGSSFSKKTFDWKALVDKAISLFIKFKNPTFGTLIFQYLFSTKKSLFMGGVPPGTPPSKTKQA